MVRKSVASIPLFRDLRKGGTVCAISTYIRPLGERTMCDLIQCLRGGTTVWWVHLPNLVQASVRSMGWERAEGSR